MKGAVQIKFIVIIKTKPPIVIIVRGCLKQFHVALVYWSVRASDSKSKGESTNFNTSGTYLQMRDMCVIRWRKTVRKWMSSKWHPQFPQSTWFKVRKPAEGNSLSSVFRCRYLNKCFLSFSTKALLHWNYSLTSSNSWEATYHKGCVATLSPLGGYWDELATCSGCSSPLP